MVPATHSSAPYHESEDGEAQRPPPDEAENHQRDPGWFSKLMNGKCPLPGFMPFGAIRKRDPGLEHRGVVGRLGPCKFEIGLAQPIERGKWLRAAIVPCL